MYIVLLAANLELKSISYFCRWRGIARGSSLYVKVCSTPTKISLPTCVCSMIAFCLECRVLLSVFGEMLRYAIEARELTQEQYVTYDLSTRGEQPRHGLAVLDCSSRCGQFS